MRGTPRSEQEVKRIFESGIYKFKILNAIETLSRGEKTKGTPMFELELLLFHNIIQGKTTTLKCYILNSPNFEFLIRHLYSSINKIEEYNSGNWIAHKLIDQFGFVKIGIEVDKSFKYPDKNRVIDFVDDQIGEQMVEFQPNNMINKNLNDDIPFL